MLELRKSLRIYLTVAAAVMMMAAGECRCGAQDLPSADLKPVKPERDTSAISAPPVPPAVLKGMLFPSGPMRFGYIHDPGEPMTPLERYERQLARISDGLYNSMQRNFAASIWVPSREEMVISVLASMLLTPQFSVPYGYWTFNPSFPLALTKIPEQRDYINMYGPEFFPQYIRTVRDEKTGIFVQEAVPFEQINTNGWHLGGSDTTPLNLGPGNPVEREIQRINGGR